VISGVVRIWGSEMTYNVFSGTLNPTLNKVHVAGPELQQLLSHNTNTFGEATTQPLSDFVQL